MQINSFLESNQITSNKLDYVNKQQRYYKYAKDSISFKMAPHTYKIPRINTGLRKLLFGTGIPAAIASAVAMATEQGLSIIPLEEHEIINNPKTGNVPKSDPRVFLKFERFIKDENLGPIYDKDLISKLKDKELLDYIKENGFKVYRQKDAIRTCKEYTLPKKIVMPFEVGTVLTLDDKQIIIPEDYLFICSDLSDNWELVHIKDFFENEGYSLFEEDEKKADLYHRTIQRSYTDEKGNVVEYSISRYNHGANAKMVYNASNQLIYTSNIINSFLQNLEYDTEGRILKQMIKNAAGLTVYKYSYDNNGNVTISEINYKSGFEILDGNNGYRKDNLTIRRINSDYDKNDSYFIDEKTLEKFDKAYQRALKKNPNLGEYKIIIDEYRFSSLSEGTIIVSLITQDGNIIRREATYKNNNGRQELDLNLDNIV